MTDDPYMTVPIFVREGRFDEAIAQVLGTHARLLDAEKHLLRHQVLDHVDSWLETSVTGDLKYYFNRPRLQGDLHGFGSYLLAGAEIVRMQSKERRSQ